MDRAKVNNCGDESGILVRELILYFVTFLAPEIRTEINSELNPGESANLLRSLIYKQSKSIAC